MKKQIVAFASTLAVASLSVFIYSCGEGRGSGNVIANAAKLLSSDYTTISTQSVTACTATSAECTPSGFGGRVFAGSTMLHSSGSDTGGYAMTFLAATEEIINRPDVGKTGSLLFDLTAPAVFSGKISIPGEAEMPTSPVIKRVEFAFDFIDTTFTLENTANSASNGDWIVRTIFVKDDTIDGLAVVGGDLLIKPAASGTFEWCNSDGCSSTTKPTSHFKTSSIVDALAITARDGNPNYGYYSVDFPTPLAVTFAEISDITRLWTLDFDVTNAIQWEANPSTFDSKQDILDNFSIPYACNFDGCPDAEGISATLTIGEAASVPATE